MKNAWTAARSFALGANLASVRLLSRPMVLYHYCNASLLLRDSCAALRRVPQRHPWEVFDDICDTNIVLPRLSYAWGWQDPFFGVDLVALALLCRAARPTCVFEIGTFKGYTALLFATNSAANARIFTLDLPPGDAGHGAQAPLTAKDRVLAHERESVPPCFAGHEAGGRITQLLGDSGTFDFSSYEDKVDLFFVDGAHSYEYVRKDTASALRCVRPGGIIAWHDYGRRGLSRGVTQWLNELNCHCELFAVPGSAVAYMSCTKENLLRAREFVPTVVGSNGH